MFLLTFASMIAQQLRQSYTCCRHQYFMKNGHELNSFVFISRDCMFYNRKKVDSRINRLPGGIFVRDFQTGSLSLSLIIAEEHVSILHRFG